MRLAALELLLIEILPWVDRSVIDDAERAIGADMESGDRDEQAIRRHALALIEDGRKRYEGGDLAALLKRLAGRGRT